MLFFSPTAWLMGSSAQKCSGVHWCRRQVRFNEVPEKVPKVPEKVWEALVQSQGGFGAKPAQLQQGSGEGSGEGLGGFGAEPGQVQQGSGEDAGCRARSGSTGFRRRFQRRSGRLWCSQVRFNRVRVPEKVPEKVLEKVPGGFGAELGQGLGGVGAESGQV